MKIPFRQGIVSAGTNASHVPTFVSLANGGFVNLNATQQPVVLAFAYKYHGNYLVELRKDLPNAWGPFVDPSKTAHLYWDINFATGALTYGWTFISPVYESTAPTSPQLDQHWFDTTAKIMKVWNGTGWIETLRVFAAVVANASTVTPYPFGTQAGLDIEVAAGFILYDDANAPIRTSEGYFFTTETDASAHFSPSVAAIKIEQSVLVMEATEPMTAYSLVAVNGANKIRLADSSDPAKAAIGVVTTSLTSGGVSDVIFRGVITVPNWSNVLFDGSASFPDNQVGKPVYLGSNGQFTWVRPPNLMAQRIGVVLNPQSVYLTFDSETIPYPASSGSNVVGSGPITVTNTPQGQQIGIDNATHTTPGAMSAADKVALDSIPSLLADEIQHRIDGDFAAVPKTGGIMTGALILSGDPVADLQAAPKQYVLQAVADATANLDGGSF